MGTDCAVHRHGSRVPLEVHHVWPLGDGGPNIASNRRKVCANGHYEVHNFYDLLMVSAGHVPWKASRGYGWKVRALARAGYLQATTNKPSRLARLTAGFLQGLVGGRSD